MYNEIRITYLTFNCWVIFIVDDMVKQNHSLSKVKDDIKAKENKLQQITGKYSKKYIYYGKLTHSIFQTRP